MEILINCPVCELYEKQKGTFSNNRGTIRIIDNDMTYIFDCLNVSGTNHSSILFILNQKFDLLFESGLSAKRDKYYREAISSFSTSLERFYEYCIKVLLFENGNDQIEKSWKQISKQSERQLGAFIVLYLQKTGKSPTLLSNKMIELRNKIIHKGYYPNEKETDEFMMNILEIINNIYSSIKEKSEMFIEQYNISYFDELKKISLEKIKNHSYYKKGIEISPEHIYKNIERPFSKILPTFLSNLNREEYNILEIEKYNSDNFKYYT